MANGPNEVIQIDFFFHEGLEFMHIIDAFSRFSVTGRIDQIRVRKEGAYVTSQARGIVYFLLDRWIGLFGVPQIIFLDPDNRFSIEGIQNLCETFGVSIISTPAKEHQAIGIVERHHHIMRSFFKELRNKSDLSAADS